MKTTIAIVGILALIGVGAYFYNLPREEITSGKVRGIDDVTAITSSDIAWNFEHKGTDEATGVPSTMVSVTIKQNTYPLGVYQGSCSLQDAATFEQNKLSGILCWFAGAGDEFGVYRENNRLVIKHREVGEGDPEGGQVSTEFKTILTI